MELLGEKGTDLLSGAERGLADSSASRGVGQASESSRPLDTLDERAVMVVAVVVALVSTYLYFHELTLTGLTWDEWMDYGIALDYAKNQSFFTNLDDPSQARFSHLVAAASFALFGESYLAFKLPFVMVGLGAGLGLWWFLARKVRPAVAALGAAMYFSCPYVLAASRTGATAGDAIVMATTVGFVITLTRWLETDRFWPWGASCSVMCGLAVGSKWTCALLLASVVLAWAYELLRRRSKLLDGNAWASVLAHQWLAVGLALFASPTLMLGVPFVKSALGHSLKFTGMAMLQFGEMRAAAPWYYIPAVLISKYSLPQLLVFVCAMAALVAGVFTRRKKLGRVQLVCLLSMLPMVPLATKGFQNAHYYVATVPSVMLLSALTLNRWLSVHKGTVQTLLLGTATGALCLQLHTAFRLAPDYLLAGRQFGKSFYGQFSGPAVNHCQGLPLAVQELNRVVEQGGPRSAFILHSCLAVMQHAQERGPVKPTVRVVPYTPSTKPEHFVVVPGSHDYDSVGEADLRNNMGFKTEVLAKCRPAGRPHVDFELWRCPAR